MKKFIEELKRRNVIKSALAYLVVAWILQQVFTNLLPLFDAPNWVLKGITIIMAIGLPIWIIVSWVYDITPQGIEKTTKESGSELITQATNKRLNVFIIVSLSIAVIVLTLNLSFFSSNSNNENAIAIMPFDYIKVDKGNEWLGESFAQDVYAYLSNVKSIRVIDFHSSRKYKNSGKSAMEIGKELEVFYILRGTITQLNNKLKITVQLIKVDSNNSIWSKSYEEFFMEDVLKLQQEVCQKIVAQLKLKLSTEEKETLETFPTKNLEASIFFTEGLNMADRRSENSNDSILAASAELFQKAIDLDSNYAEAYAEKAFVLRMMNGRHEIFKNKDSFKLIDALLKRSLEINPKTVRAYTTLGAIQGIENQNWEKAKKNFDKALSIKPNDATTHQYYAFYYDKKTIPNYEMSLKETKIALRLNPHSIPINLNIITYLLRLDKIIEAKEFYKNNSYKFLDDDKLESKKSIFNASIKKESFEKKDLKIALNMYHKGIEEDPNDSYLQRVLGEAYNYIVNDDINYVKYTKNAYELEKLYSEKTSGSLWSSIAASYYMSLLKSGKFNEANNLLQDDYFTSLFSEPSLLYLLFYYDYYQENYSKAQVYIDSFKYAKTFELSINYAQQNKIKEVNSIFYKNVLKAYEKAVVFAILEERDSMYYYINKEKEIDNILKFNGFIEVDPYRKDERYRAFLMKNYLPLTHWNE